MALANILEVYLRNGEPSELIDKLKENDVCLEDFFNKVQLRKTQHDSKLYFRELYKAYEPSGFDEDGNIRMNFVGARLKIVYTYFDNVGVEQTDFILTE